MFDRKDAVLTFVKPCEGCAPTIATALKHFAAEVTLSHSLTSRRYAIWSLLRRHLDAPLMEVIRRYPGPWAKKLLTGFRLSTIGRRRPKWRIDTEAWVEVKHTAPRINWTRLLIPATPPKDDRHICDADRMLKNVSDWDQNLRFTIHSATYSWKKAVSSDEFCATLESIRHLIGVLQYFRPRIGKDPLNEHGGNLPDAVTSSYQYETYCELCWRYTMKTAGMASKNTPKTKARRLNNRFCSNHDPSDPTSRYRADLRYREIFQRELQVLLYKNRESGFELQIHPPASADTQERRKAAYELVHARLRPLTRPEQPGLRESVWRLHEQGMRQADIARHLGVKRQSVCRALKSTKTLLARLHDEQERNSTISESSDNSEDSALASIVAFLHERGSTAADIASVTGKPKFMIQSLLWRLAKGSS